MSGLEGRQIPLGDRGGLRKQERAVGQARWGPEPAAMTAAPPPSCLAVTSSGAGTEREPGPLSGRRPSPGPRCCGMRAGDVPAPGRCAPAVRPGRAALGPWPETAAGAAPVRRVRGGYAEGGWQVQTLPGARGPRRRRAGCGVRRRHVGGRAPGGSRRGVGGVGVSWAGAFVSANPGFHCALQQAVKL